MVIAVASGYGGSAIERSNGPLFMIGMTELARKFWWPTASQGEPAVKVLRSVVWTIALGFTLVAITLVSGGWILLDRTRQTALHAADITLQHAALTVQSVVNRQFLQVDGALASLPALLTASVKNGTESDPETATRLLR